jgi:hypothetical protein
VLKARFSVELACAAPIFISQPALGNVSIHTSPSLTDVFMFSVSFHHQAAPRGWLSRPFPSGMARNNSLVTASSAIWETIFREPRTTFALILVNFSRNVVNVQWRTALGGAACRRKLPRLKANTNSCSRTWAQHHFPYYSTQSLDIIQMPRTPEDLKEYLDAFSPYSMADVTRSTIRLACK